MAGRFARDADHGTEQLVDLRRRAPARQQPVGQLRAQGDPEPFGNGAPRLLGILRGGARLGKHGFHPLAIAGDRRDSRFAPQGQELAQRPCLGAEPADVDGAFEKVRREAVLQQCLVGAFEAAVPVLQVARRADERQGQQVDVARVQSKRHKERAARAADLVARKAIEKGIHMRERVLGPVAHELVVVAYQSWDVREMHVGRGAEVAKPQRRGAVGGDLLDAHVVQ